MNMLWSLDELYTGFDSENFKADMEKLKTEIENYKIWAKALSPDHSAVEQIEEYIHIQNNFAKYSNLIAYANLILSVESLNDCAAKALDVLEEIYTEFSQPNVRFKQYLSQIENLDEILDTTALLTEHRFVIKELQDSNRYMLSEKEEILLAKMKNTGSGAFSKLRDQLVSTVLVDIEIDGEQKKEPITIVRNYAHSKNAELRKKAYHAELKSYEKIDKSVAFALNGIKGEVITTSKLRGYDSPLSMTLIESRMDSKTLDAMLSAIQDFLPVFKKYFVKKAELLGHQNGLPFYDLFAPIGAVNMRFSFEEAAAFIVTNFRQFSQKLGDFAQAAFDNQWIDALPREGKTSGAFCSNLHSLKQSRIMTNFTGTLSDVVTLAHELGHAYHGDCLTNETYINSNYTMPIAETASNFCEMLASKAALKTATDQEKLVILEQELSDVAQSIVDIYSRFLFEDSVFKKRTEGTVSINELNEIMLSAQKEAYSGGLDETYLHPYMWLIKPHYYQADWNYYNFPYAFGALFSKGLYSQYLKCQEEGKDFTEQYDKLLAVTGKHNLLDVALQAGIRLDEKEFWVSSLKIIEADIEQFVALGKK